MIFFYCKNLQNKNLIDTKHGIKPIPGHCCVLQVSVLVVDPVHVPPWASTTVFVLVFVRRPPPQVFVQGPVHDQPPHWQLTVAVTKY